MNSYLANRGWRLTVTFGLGAAGFLWALIEVIRLKGDANVERYPYWALFAASIMYLVVFGILEYIGSRGPANRAQFGWIALLLGADGRLSTSKTQAVLWTAILATVIVFLAGIVAFGPGNGPDLFNETHWEQYLVLLGGPFAAAVLAKFTTVTKIQSGTITKSLTPAASERALGTPPASAAGGAVAGGAGAGAAGAGGAAAAPVVAVAGAPAVGAPPAAAAGPPAKAADAFSNDSGEIDIPDTQYLIFNLAAIAYFLLVYFGQVFHDHTGLDRFVLPNIPSVLLGLTSASAATYVGYKASQREAPRLVSVTPQPATVGQLVNIVGTNLVPTGETAPKERTAVMVQSLANNENDNTAIVAPDPNSPVTASSVSFIMPAQFAAREVAVRVVTAGSVATDPLRVKVN
jgi:hypothetical protein